MGIWDGVKEQAGSVVDAVKQQAGLSSGSANKLSDKDPNPLPWAAVSKELFPPIELQTDRWNKLYPYRLLVIDAETKKVIGGDPAPTLKTSPTGRIELVAPASSAWAFNLPITPQQFSVSTPYAIATTPTLRGIVEEHSGTRFKMISCAGTMGVWPGRPDLNGLPAKSTALTTLLGGTITAAAGLIGQVNRTIGAATSNHPAAKPRPPQPKGRQIEGSGYYQALLLDQFLEQYAEAKKNPSNANWRLVFDIPKENQSFVVTPIQFSYLKSADAPNEVKFQLQLKAWQRISLENKVDAREIGSPKLEVDALQKLLTTIEECRRTLGAFYNLVKAVRSDVQTPFNVLRELALFGKELVGAVAAVIDLPKQIISDADSSIKEVLTTIGLNKLSTASGSTPQGSQSFSKATKTFGEALQSSSGSKEGLSDNSIAKGQQGSEAAVALKTDPVSSVFQNPEQNFDIFNSITADQIQLTFAQQELVDKDLEIIRLKTVDDLIKNRNSLVELALQISNGFGAGDPTFSTIYSKPDPYQRLQEMTIDEYAILKPIYDVIQSLDTITATDEIDQNRIQNSFEYVGSLAADSGVPFNSGSQSKIRVPVPYGLNMEQIAARYLGNPDRWVEISTLNALRSPYIDEDGFYYDLLSNADGRQFNIPTKSNLFVGQKILLTSLTQPTITRRIINIEQISPTNYLISVDGQDNLSVFVTTDKARMRAYLPGTINSQDQIYVPSELAATDTVLARAIPAFRGDPLVGLSKVDWLLTDSGDIASDSYGDVRLAAGMSNLIQALKMKFSTPPNRLLKHPNFGAGLTPGISTADLNNSDVLSQIVKSIQNDPRYGKIISLTLQKIGPVFSVALAVELADGSGVFPISFVVNG